MQARHLPGIGRKHVPRDMLFLRRQTIICNSKLDEGCCHLKIIFRKTLVPFLSPDGAQSSTLINNDANMHCERTEGITLRDSHLINCYQCYSVEQLNGELYVILSALLVQRQLIDVTK